jgi:UDP-GlcNAc:undecaprenyl-phosphate/decaprenyl-phosphate GlcNAc-1-phosphate transferase
MDMLSRAVSEGGRIGVAFVAAFATSLLVTPAAGRAARRLGWMAMPSPRGVHTRPTPLLGGVAVMCGIAAGLLAGAPLLSGGGHRWAALAGIAILAAVGAVDDRIPLGWRSKLAWQVACAIAYAGLAQPLRSLGAAGPALAVLWIVAVTNAINLIDNSNGLASGTAAVAALAFAILGASAGSASAAIEGAVLAGAAIGFFVHNFPSGRIFLGDAGSLPLGFALSVLALALVGDRPPHALAPVLLPLGYPLFDVLYVTTARLAGGRAVVKGGTDHSVHALARRCGDLRHAVIAMLIVSAALGATAIGLELGARP